MRRRAAAVAALLAVTALAGPAAAADASRDDTVVVHDSRTDVTTGIGISRFRVHNGAHLVVTTHHRDLRRKGYGDHLVLWVDVGPAHPGPDYVLAGGLSTGTDWATGRATSRWHPRIDPLDDIGTCASDLRISWADDTARIVLDRGCLGGHQGRVRVSVQAGDGDRTDFVPARHTFSPWVARG